MRIEKNKVEFVQESDILKKVEMAGRCCYNSQNLITEDSYKDFINMIMKNGHLSVLEHSNIIIKYCDSQDSDDVSFNYEWLLARKGLTNSHLLITVEKGKFSNFIMMSGNIKAWLDFFSLEDEDEFLIDGSDNLVNIYKVLSENYPLIFKQDLFYITWMSNIEATLLTEEEAAEINIRHTSYTFKITTSRDISHQIVRHRSLSFSQQSQRWCNYTLDKNDGEITFIEPRIEKDTEDYDEWEAECENIDSLYSKFVEDKYKPEVARCILPNCTKTIIYVSGHYDDWIRFIELRDSDHAQKEIRDIAEEIKAVITAKNI